MGLIAEGVGHGGYGNGKGGWVGGVLESVKLVFVWPDKDVSHVLEKGRVGGAKKKMGMERKRGANAGCSFSLGKVNLSRGAWGEIVGDDSVDFAAKGLNSD